MHEEFIDVAEIFVGFQPHLWQQSKLLKYESHCETAVYDTDLALCFET